MRRKHFVYKTVEDNQTRPQSLSILLQKYVEGKDWLHLNMESETFTWCLAFTDVGRPGDIVTVKETMARLLLLKKAAVYTTPENIAAAGVVTAEDTFSSLYAGTVSN